MLLGRVQTRSADNAGEAWVETEKTWYEITRFVEVIGVLHVRAVDVSVHLVHESSGTPVFVSFSKASHCLRGILCTAAGEHALVAV